MVGVASQIIFCIFAAAVIGSVAGYLIGGLRHATRIADIERLWQAKLQQRDDELVQLRDAGYSTVAAAESHRNEAVLLQAKSTPEETIAATQPSNPVATRGGDVGHFEDKLSEALRLIEKLARSQERMENEIVALRNGAPGEFKLEPSTPKS
jgi:hypothetical protein